MTGLRPLWNAWQRAYYRAARAQIHPLHPDLPLIIRRLAELGDA